MADTDKHGEPRLSVFQVFILILSIVVLGLLLVDTLVKLPPEVTRAVRLVDFGVCVLFFIDFCTRFASAKDKLAFMKWGWIDLLASIPNIEALRWGRLARVMQIIRLLRAVRSTHKVLRLILRNKLQNGLTAVGLTTFLLVIFGSIAILICEQTPDSNIKTAEDAIWWSITTITTVGYGDKYPVTFEGRVLAMSMMIAGLGLFGTLSGIFASFFLGSGEDEAGELKEISKRLEAIEKRLIELENHHEPPSPAPHPPATPQSRLN